MGKRKKPRHLVGLGLDVGEPGLDRPSEVEDVIQNVLALVYSNELTPGEAGKVFGALKTAIRRSEKFSDSEKKRLLGAITDALDQLKEIKKTKKKRKKKSRKPCRHRKGFLVNGTR